MLEVFFGCNMAAGNDNEDEDDGRSEYCCCCAYDELTSSIQIIKDICHENSFVFQFQ